MRTGTSWGILLAAAMVGTPAFVTAPSASQPGATGVVFEDLNRNGVRDEGERGIKGVRVSNMRTITRTDSGGRWRLPATEDTIFFVVKPRNWMTPTDEHGVPRYYYNHKPQGSPTLKHAGVPPTGPIPASIDFPLHRSPEPDRFSALFFGDTQPRDLREVDYIARKIVDPLIGATDARFGVTLGDIVFDNLAVTEPLVQAIGLIGLPWYYVIGNHDINFDADTDEQSDEHFERLFGPAYYSFDHGPTHFVVLDNVYWVSAKEDPERRAHYKAALGAQQLEWLRQDLAEAPPNQLVVVMMHIPLNELVEKEAVFRLLEQRPYALSVSAHTHFQEHRFFGEKDGWRGAKPHHHVVNVTTCGSWWAGAPDALGIPHTTMRDGAPNGYSVFTFDGNQYSIAYRAAGRPASYQMNILLPDALKLAQVRGTPVHANVFGGTEFSTVEMRFADGPWIPMKKVVEPDPSFVEASKREAGLTPPFRPLPAPMASPHLWKSFLTGAPGPGVYPVSVRTTDMFGQSAVSTRALRVE